MKKIISIFIVFLMLTPVISNAISSGLNILVENADVVKEINLEKLSQIDDDTIMENPIIVEGADVIKRILPIPPDIKTEQHTIMEIPILVEGADTIKRYKLGEEDNKEIDNRKAVIEVNTIDKIYLELGVLRNDEITIDSVIYALQNLTNANLTLMLPQNTEIIEGDKIIELGNINMNSYLNKSWKIKINELSTSILNFKIILSSDNNEPIEKEINIGVVRLDGENIISFDTTYPSLFSVNDNKKLNFKGHGFYYIENIQDLNINIYDTTTPDNKITIDNKDIKIINNNLLEVLLPDGLAEGVYSIDLSHENTGKTIDNAFEINANTNRKSRIENEIRVGQLVIKGDIEASLNEPYKYNVTGNITINEVLKYDGVLNIDMQLLSISGDGKLYMPVKIGNKTGDIDIIKGDFEINATTLYLSKLGEGLSDLLQYNGVPISIEEVSLILGEEKGVKLSGSFGGKLLNGTKIDELTITNNGIEVVGTIKMNQEINIGVVALSEVEIELDTIQNLIGGKGKLEIGKLISVSGGFELIDGNLNQVEIIAGTKIPIGTTPFAFIELGGSLDNLATESPVEVSLISSIAMIHGAPKIDDRYILTGDKLTLTISTEKISAAGKLFIYSYELASSEIELSQQYGFSLVGELNIGDWYKAEASLKVPKDSKFNGYAKGTLMIPEETGLRFVDGFLKATKVSGTTLLSNSATIDTEEITTSVSVPLKVLTLNGWEDSGKDAYITVKFKYTDFMPEFDYGYNAQRINDNWYTQWGDNLEIVGVYTSESKDFSALGESFESVTIPIQDQSITMLNITWESGTPLFKVINPNGIEFELSEDAVEQYYTVNTEEKSASVVLLTDINGDWTIESLDSSLIGMTVEVVNVDSNAEIEEFTVTQLNEEYTANWNINSDADTNVSLYVSDNNDSHTGILIKENLPLEGSEIITIPNYLRSGDYYLFIKAAKVNSAPQYVYSEHVINYTDNNSLNPPLNLSNIRVNNGEIEMSWDHVVDERLSRYIIGPLDENNELDFSKSVSVDKEFNSAVLKGLENELEYNISVIAVNEETINDEVIKHYSEQSEAIKVYLPTPALPVIDVNWTVDNGILKEENENSNTYYLNNTLLNGILLNHEIKNIKIYLNDELLIDEENTGFDTSFELKEGLNNLLIEAINEVGDIGIKEYKFIVDTSAPTLYIHTPLNGDSIGDDKIYISGNAEKSSTITINGVDITIDEEGNFEHYIDFNNIDTEIVTIIARDFAGNETIYEAEVINATPRVTIIGKIIVEGVEEIPEITLELKDKEGNVINTTKTINGNYEFSNVIPDNYTISIEKLDYYAVNESIEVIVFEGDNKVLEDISYLFGDFNNDNTINLIDILSLCTRYGISSNDEAYESAYDINDDNIIDIFDLVILAKKIDKNLMN